METFQDLVLRLRFCPAQMGTANLIITIPSIRLSITVSPSTAFTFLPHILPNNVHPLFLQPIRLPSNLIPLTFSTISAPILPHFSRLYPLLPSCYFIQHSHPITHIHLNVLVSATFVLSWVSLSYFCPPPFISHILPVDIYPLVYFTLGTYQT